ncbi:MAG TPA: matrixin family metalloprotease [Pyrinomonadaceae bacterium]|jgi:hypothetical protein
MRRLITALILGISLVGWSVPARAYTHQYTDSPASLQIKWPSTIVTVAFSTSLSQPPSNIKAGSDVLGAVRRALAHWSQNSNIRFIETTSRAQSISPSGSGDSVSLISVADTPENRAVFGTDQVRTGRTRVFFNPDSGAITEADVIINPNLQFSTDSTPGTYDLEATLTHELGHLLGLEHSTVTGATMQPRQGQNGLYGQPALTPRTLSDDDRAGIRALYGPHDGLGAIAGTISLETLSYGAHVWAENVATGQITEGNVKFANGTFRIEGLQPGDYRVVAEPLDGTVSPSESASTRGVYAGLAATQPRFRSIELASSLSVAANTTTQFNAVVASSDAPTINPRLFGINSQLSTIPVPLAPGNTYKLYIGGEGLDRVQAAGVTISSPHFTIKRDTFTQQDFGIGVPVITFDVTIDESAPAGDYSIEFVATGDEIAHLSGALTIDSPQALAQPNTVDDARLFVSQHHPDFFNTGAQPVALETDFLLLLPDILLEWAQ